VFVFNIKHKNPACQALSINLFSFSETQPGLHQSVNDCSLKTIKIVFIW